MKKKVKKPKRKEVLKSAKWVRAKGHTTGQHVCWLVTTQSPSGAIRDIHLTADDPAEVGARGTHAYRVTPYAMRVR